jgi:ATP-dependent Zn protease
MSLTDGNFDPATYDREATAYHEAGHVVIAVIWDLPFYGVAIRPPPDLSVEQTQAGHFADDTLGHAGFPDEDEKVEAGHWFGKLQMTLAGGAAEAKFLGKRYEIIINDSDFGHAYRICKLSHEEDYLKVMRDCRESTVLAVSKHWPQIEAVANALIEHGRLTSEEVKHIVNGDTMPDVVG